jgi:hypothetical protein
MPVLKYVIIETFRKCQTGVPSSFQTYDIEKFSMAATTYSWSFSVNVL